MLKYVLYCLLFFPIVSIAQSDNKLTYQDAVALALKNNYDILMAQNNVSIAERQNTLGNAGMLPRLDLNASGSKSSNNTKQNFSSGLTVNQDGVRSDNISAGAYLSWTVFDGMKMFATKERLNLLAQQGQLGLRLQIENTLEEVTLYYYQIVKQEQLIKGIHATMDVSEERIKLADKKMTLGAGSKVEVLQAKMDLNAQKSILITQQYLLNEFKNNLLVLIKSEQSPLYTVDSAFEFTPLQSMEEIKRKIQQSNTSILMAEKNVSIYGQTIKELRSQGLPKLGLTSNYLFGRNTNAAGFSLLNQNLGFNYGFTFSWNIFNGLNTRNQVKVAKLQTQNMEFAKEQTIWNLTSSAQNAYTRWLGDKEICTIEEENIKLAEQSLHITTERLRLGLGNYLEIQQSQSSFEDAITRLVNARYNLKQSETALRKMTGELLKER